MNKIEYSGRYFIEEKLIKDILQKEFDRHTQEIKEHGEQFSLTGSARQRRKLIKHLDKLWEVKHIAKLLGIELKRKLNQIEFLKKICDVHNSDYRAIKERIGELENDRL